MCQPTLARTVLPVQHHITPPSTKGDPALCPNHTYGSFPAPGTRAGQSSELVGRQRHDYHPHAAADDQRIGAAERWRRVKEEAQVGAAAAAVYPVPLPLVATDSNGGINCS